MYLVFKWKMHHRIRNYLMYIVNRLHFWLWTEIYHKDLGHCQHRKWIQGRITFVGLIIILYIISLFLLIVWWCHHPPLKVEVMTFDYLFYNLLTTSYTIIRMKYFYLSFSSKIYSCYAELKWKAKIPFCEKSIVFPEFGFFGLKGHV